MPVPATLPDGITEDSLKITWFDDANNDWVDLPSTVSGGFVTATVDHFSSFGMGGSKSGSSGSSSSSSGSTGSGSGGGGGGGGGGGSGTFFIGGDSGILTNLKIYEVSYDLCNDGQVTIIVGASTDDFQVKLRSPIAGLTYATFETHLTDYSNIPGERVLKFVAPIHPDEDYLRIEVDQTAGRSSQSTVKSVNLFGCEGSEIFTIPEVYAESSKVTAIPQQDNSFKSTPINGGEFIQSSLDEYTFNIWYLMNGKIVSLDVDENNNMLGMDLDQYVEGTVTLSLSRLLIDAENDKFVIVSAPLDIDRYEIVESTESNVILEFTPPAGTERIEIYGSKVVPEFGSLVFVILLMSILSVALVSRKTSLSIN
jgi:predicted secreted protein with PEFG-CTERM motif